MVVTCGSYAQSKFDDIIKRDYDKISHNYEPENSILYIIYDYKIFMEVYNHCKGHCSKYSIDLYFGEINYDKIKYLLDIWSLFNISFNKIN